MIKLYGVAYLKKESPFAKIFPDENVPISSFFNSGNNAEFFGVDLTRITAIQLLELADILFDDWNVEKQSDQTIVAYVKRYGCPIKSSWFCGFISASKLPIEIKPARTKENKCLYILDESEIEPDWLVT